MSTKFITDEDKADYFGFLKHHFDQLVTSRVQGGGRQAVKFRPLFHYTSGENLIQIIQSGELWSTQIACLNDTKELVHAVDVLLEAIKERQNGKLRPEFDKLLRTISSILSNANPEVVGIFVSCFSESKDDLSQWRAYGGANGGYALEFKTEELLQYASRMNAYLVPVTYDQTSKNAVMSDILKWSEIFLMRGISASRAPTTDEWIEEFAAFWIEQLTYLAPLLKHESFKGEQEWRLIYQLRPSDLTNLRFTERATMMRRHLPLVFNEKDENDYSSLPISGVMVGPKTYQKLTKIAVGDLLTTKGYSTEEVPVSASEIPYRLAT